MGTDPALGAYVGGAIGKVLVPVPPLLSASLGARISEGTDPKVERKPQKQVLWGLEGVQRERAVQGAPTNTPCATALCDGEEVFNKAATRFSLAHVVPKI